MKKFRDRHPKNIGKFLCILSSAAVLFSSPVRASEPSAESSNAGRRIGVVSVAGDRLFQFHIGRLAFGNNEESADIKDWQLDDDWERQFVAAASAANDDIQLVDLSIDRLPIYGAYPNSGTQSVVRKERSLDFDRGATEFQRIAAAENLDGIVVVSSSFRNSGSLYLEGPTILTERTFAGPNAFYWLVIEASYVDGATGLRQLHRRVGDSGRIFERVPKELRAKRFPEYTTEEVSFIRDRYRLMPEPHWSKVAERLLAGAK